MPPARAKRTERRYRRHPDIVGRAIGNATILVPVKSNIVELHSLFTLNETGAFVWDQLEPPATIEQIARAMAQRFEVSVTRARADVRRLVERLVKEGCAHEHDARASQRRAATR